MHAIPLFLLFGSLLWTPAPEVRDLKWSCAEPEWKAAGVGGGQFTGTLEVACTMTPDAAGDYTKLLSASHEELKKTAKEIHAGPTAETYEGLPSTLYDATIPVNEDGVEAIRADNHIASDGKDRFIVAVLSKEIFATGFAKNLLRANNVITAQRGAAGSHDVTVRVDSVVKKPAIIGAAKFQSMVMEQMEAKLKEKEKLLVETLAAQMGG